MNVARVIQDPDDPTKDEYLTVTTARNMYHLGQLEIHETNPVSGVIVYRVVHDADKHPQWETWKAWYTKHHGAYIPMAQGQPSTFPTLVSWQSWCAAWEATKPKWRSFVDEKPALSDEDKELGNMVEILWRFRPAPTAPHFDVGIGWYCAEDADSWTGEWVLVSEIQ